MLILYLNVFREQVMCFGMIVLLLKYFLFVIFSLVVLIIGKRISTILITKKGSFYTTLLFPFDKRMNHIAM